MEWNNIGCDSEQTVQSFIKKLEKDNVNIASYSEVYKWLDSYPSPIPFREDVFKMLITAFLEELDKDRTSKYTNVLMALDTFYFDKFIHTIQGITRHGWDYSN